MNSMISTVVTTVFLLQLILIDAGSVFVMFRCWRAFQAMGFGEVGTRLNASTIIAAISWTLSLAGWIGLLFLRDLAAGTAFILISETAKLISLSFQWRAYSALYRMGLDGSDVPIDVAPGAPLRRLKLLMILTTVPLVLAVAVFAAIGIEAAIEVQPIRYLNEPFPTANPVRVGDPLGTRVERCNDSGATIVTYNARRLVNLDTGAEYLMTPGAGISQPGCTTAVGDAVIPAGVPPGRYQAVYALTFAGRWRVFSVVQHSQEFEVVP